MRVFINVTKRNRAAVQEWIKLGILKSYDLQGSVGREKHDKRTAMNRKLRDFYEEEMNSRIVPYS